MFRPVLTLYQFPRSHFCEKARWALDHKGLEYRIVNLVPGPHSARTRKLTGGSSTSVPILCSGEKVIAGSGEIITWLDRQHAARQLTPTNTQDAAMALEWERSADANIGVPLRLFFYQHVLQDRALATRLLTAECPWWSGPLYALIFPVVRSRMRAAMKIDADNAATALKRLEQTFTQIETRLARQRFLAGPLFSRADLTVSALLAPTWRGIDGLPAAVSDMIEQHRTRPLMSWARAIYDEYRHLRR